MRQILITTGLFFISNLFGQNLGYELVIKPSATNVIYYGKDKELISLLENNGGGMIDFGVIINKQVNENRYFGLGIFYNQFGTNNIHVGHEVSGDLNEIKEKYRLKNISVPIQITKNFKKNKVITCGISNNVLFRSKHEIIIKPNSSENNDTAIINNISDLKSSKYRIYNPSFDFSFGWSIPISEHIKFNIQPCLSFLLFDIIKDGNDVNRLYYKYGINFKLIKY